MKVAHYSSKNGGTLTVEYDENAPCRICGEPVVEASMGGTNVCPWCDTGQSRHGETMIRPPVKAIEQRQRPIRLPSKCPRCGFKGINLDFTLDGRIFITCRVCQQTFEKSAAELILERELNEDDKG